MTGDRKRLNQINLTVCVHFIFVSQTS